MLRWLIPTELRRSWRIFVRGFRPRPRQKPHEGRNGGVSAPALSLAGRTGIVTGGGSGIGRAMVELFAAAGVRVVAADNRAERLESLPAGVVKVEADVSTAAGADRIIDAAG